MKVEQDNKTLYHIQNTNMGSDGYPLDTYVWCDHFPTHDDLRRAFDLAFPEGYSPSAIEEWLTSSEVYIVYADNL